MKQSIILLLLLILASSCNNNNQQKVNNTPENITNKVTLASDIEWEMLNPARGEQSPQAGTIWGDRKGTVATGFLAKFVKGFSSPPHIHNVSYRGIVIKGLIHNDDPNAEKMWMPAGSYWTQPEGEAHITAADDEDNLAYIEIEKGPYLVHPTEKAFDNGERPINVDKSNLVWLDASEINWIENTSSNGAKVAFLWGKHINGQLNGSLIKLPAGFSGTIKSQGDLFRAVIIKGNTFYQIPTEDKVYSLDPGSSFSSNGSSIHNFPSKLKEESIIYIRTNGTFEILEK